ncbi:MAG: hypothetical protein WA906_03725 [Pacificimonas sp.]
MSVMPSSSDEMHRTIPQMPTTAEEESAPRLALGLIVMASIAGWLVIAALLTLLIS